MVFGGIFDEMGAGQSSRRNTRDQTNNITCPFCQATFPHELALVQHCNCAHSESRASPAAATPPSGREFKSGDKVLAMWDSAKWQYFPAVIVKRRETDGRYEINWDDGDTTGLLFSINEIHGN